MDFQSTFVDVPLIAVTLAAFEWLVVFMDENVCFEISLCGEASVAVGKLAFEGLLFVVTSHVHFQISSAFEYLVAA